MTASVAALVAAQLAMAAFSGPVWAYIDRAAADQIARTPYIEAVLSQGDRGSGTSDEETEGSEVSPSPNPTASPLETTTPTPEPSLDPSPQSGVDPSPDQQSGTSTEDPDDGSGTADTGTDGGGH